MLYTFPQAEITFPSSMNGFGIRRWEWVEIAIPLPLYLVTGETKTEKETHVRDFIFCQLIDVLSIVDPSQGILSNVSVSLISPSYLNGTDTYKFGAIREIWVQPNLSSELFVLRDGTRLRHSYVEDDPEDEHEDEDGMELVLSL